MSKETPMFETDDGRAIVLAWLSDSSSDPDEYLTKNGKSYLNGYLQANNTMQLIKLEKYTQLTDKYEELIKKYEKLKNIKIKKNKSIINKIMTKIYK